MQKRQTVPKLTVKHFDMWEEGFCPICAAPLFNGREEPCWECGSGPYGEEIELDLSDAAVVRICRPYHQPRSATRVPKWLQAIAYYFLLPVLGMGVASVIVINLIPLFVFLEGYVAAGFDYVAASVHREVYARRAMSTNNYEAFALGAMLGLVYSAILTIRRMLFGEEG